MELEYFEASMVLNSKTLFNKFLIITQAFDTTYKKTFVYGVSIIKKSKSNINWYWVPIQS